MQMQRRQFCLTVSVGVATTALPGRPAEARRIPWVGTGMAVLGVGLVLLGLVLLPVAGTVGAVGGAMVLFGVGGFWGGLLVCDWYPASCSIGRIPGNVALLAAGDEVSAGLGVEGEGALSNVPLQHIPDGGAETRDLVAAANQMMDAQNRLQRDIRDGQELDGALTGLRLSIGQVQAEVGRLDAGASDYQLTAADIAAGRASIQADGFPSGMAAYLRGCGFSEATMSVIRQRFLDADPNPAVGKSAVELLGALSAAVPDASDLTTPAVPLVPVPDPAIDR